MKVCLISTTFMPSGNKAKGEKVSKVNILNFFDNILY